MMPTWKRAMRHTGYSRLFLAGVLSQTRGSGTPPPLVVLRSKRKFIRSVAEAPPDMTRTQQNLVVAALHTVMGELPDHIFTGLETKARVTVTGSACWESTRAEGGTAQAVLEIMTKYDGDRMIPIIDLDTGENIEYRRKADFESIGTAVFWACLSEVMGEDPQYLSEVFLTLVKEPGKARVVTKGHAALKIVLDTVSKICAGPLKKGFKSSESGMGKSHHGWNLFRDMFSEEFEDILFSENRKLREEDVYVDHIERLVVWEELYCSSTDYQEATDRLIHLLGRIIGSVWMRKCGIPPVLRGIVMAICYRPRKVYFSASGALKTEGRPVEGDPDLRYVTLYRGVLMGDPLTKVVLHFTNIVARQLGQSMTDGSIFSHFPGNGYEAATHFHEAVWGHST